MRSAPRFRPAPQLRSHEYVAEQIRRQITLGVLGDGEALPTERALTDFHLRIAQASHNRCFIEAVEQVRLALSEALVALPESGLWHDRTAREHAAIVEALARRDGGAAAAAMLRHVESTAKSIRALVNALR